MHRTKICLSAAYGLLLAAFTVFLLLDTFVIPHVYSNAESRTESAYEPLLSAGERLGDYNDGGVSIRLTAYRCFDSDIFAAEVWLSSPDQLKTALAKEAYGRNLKEQPSVMAERNHAILAVNGDYYGAQEKGHVLRNGSIYPRREPRDRRIWSFTATAPLVLLRSSVRRCRPCRRTARLRRFPSALRL